MAKNGSKIVLGIEVQNKATLKRGKVIEFCKLRNYVVVEYGEFLKDHYVEHIQELLIFEK